MKGYGKNLNCGDGGGDDYDDDVDNDHNYKIRYDD